MLKKSFLTPVLSGVLAVTVAGSGALYYFQNKGSSKDTEEAEKADKAKNKTVAVDNPLAQVTENMEDTFELAEKAIKGELDFAYTAKAEVIFGDAVSRETGYDLKPFAIETSTKQKDKKSAADISLQYDSRKLASLNTVIDNETGTVYLRIPELSSAYLYADEEIMEELLESMNYSYYDDYSAYGGMTTMAITSMSTGDEDLDALLAVIESIDPDVLYADLEEYVQVIADNAPGGKENGTIKGDIDGNAYEYDVITYEVNGQVMVDIVKGIADKVKTDQILKDIFVPALVTESDYNELMAALDEDIDADSDDLNEVYFSFDLYLDGNEVRGYSFDLEDEYDLRMVTIEKSDVFAVDYVIADNYGTSMKLKGSMKDNGGKVNGGFDFTFEEYNTVEARLGLTLTDIEAQGELFSGSVKLEMEADGETAAMEIASSSTADKLDLTCKLSALGEDYVTVKLTGEATDASDITLPSGDMYSLDETGVESYLYSCDPDGFMDNIKAALGEDLYKEFFGPSYDHDYYDDILDLAYDL